jgi:uncharacterized protein YcaQ
VKITRETERRFVLGMQGLWPGRRWEGRDGIREALGECRQVQVDPLDVVGHNHDLVFASRLVDYRPSDLDAVLYTERAAFEHGGAVFLYPRESLPLAWSELQHRGLPDRWRSWHRANRRIVSKVLEEIRRQGPLESRHWVEGEVTQNYRARRLEGLALQYLWRSMAIFVHHRTFNRKFYDTRERLFGPTPKLLSLEETRTRSAVDLARWMGVSGRFWLTYLPGAPGGGRRTLGSLRSFRDRLIDEGHLAAVEIEGEREPGVLRAVDLPLLEAVANGDVPRKWTPRTDLTEAVFLAPLDVVFTRGRSKKLFGFDYTWEVYKPEAKRRWGYYVLPVLLGDRLVGRIEPTQNRVRKTFSLDRAWWEPGVDPRSLVAPMARGLRRTADSLGLSKIRLGRVGPGAFRDSLARELARSPNGP